jgi:hypothetical protein
MNYNKLLVGLALIVGLASCKKDDKKTDDTSAAGSSNITNIVEQDSWKVTLYNDSGSDKTSSYNGYVFTFKSGTVSASKAGSTVTGTYAYKLDDSKHKLVLNFASPASFSELSDDWHIVEQTTTKIRLEDVSGGNGGTDLLTFEKN